MTETPSVATPPVTRRARVQAVVIALAALVGIGITARLGLWQLDRAAQKEALAAAIEQRSQSHPLHGDSLFAPDVSAHPDALQHRVVQLQGQWLPAHSVYLDNRQMSGKPGFYVLTPLQLTAPPGAAPHVVMVQRGWAPRNFVDRTALPHVDTPAGTVNVTGRIALAPSKLLELGGEGEHKADALNPAASAASRIRQNLDLGTFRVETGLPLSPLMVVQTGAASEGLLRDWPLPATDVPKHMGYAFQWFGLAVLIAVLYVWFQLVRPYRQRFRQRRLHDSATL